MAIGFFGFRLNEFYDLSIGEYRARCNAYINKSVERQREHRALLGAIVRENPLNLYFLPGDNALYYNNIPKILTAEEIEERMRKLGNPEVLKIHKIDG